MIENLFARWTIESRFSFGELSILFQSDFTIKHLRLQSSNFQKLEHQPYTLKHLHDNPKNSYYHQFAIHFNF